MASPPPSPEPNPLSVGVGAPVPSATPIVEKPDIPAKLQPQGEETGRQDSLWSGAGVSSQMWPAMLGMPFYPQSFWGSQGFAGNAPFYNQWGAIGLNNFGIPIGSWSNYWMMERNATVALAEAAADAPVKAAEIAYECRDGVDPDLVKEVRDAFLPFERDYLNEITLSRGWGCRQAELVWSVKKGKRVLSRIKWLAPELTIALRDIHGNLVGLQNQGAEIDDPRRYLWLAYDGRGTNPYGRSRRENCKKPWLRNEMLWDLAEYAMNIQVRPFGKVEYPYGLKDANGASMNDQMKAAANNIAQSMSQGQFSLVPNPFAAWTEDMLQHGVDPSKVMPFKIDWYSAKTDSGEGFQRMFNVTDRGIVMGILMPPRSLLEGPGTQADAKTHTDTGVLVNEVFLEQAIRVFNEGPINTYLVQNYGEDMRGAVYWKPSPLMDEQVQFNNDLVKDVLGSELGPFVRSRVMQLSSIFEKAGVKVSKFDQDKLVADAEAASAAKRAIAIELMKNADDGNTPPNDNASGNKLEMSLAIQATTPMTEKDKKRRKAFLLLLLGYFVWQQSELVADTGMKATDAKFNERLSRILQDGMRDGIVLEKGPIARFYERVQQTADRVAKGINETTEKNVVTRVEKGESRADAVEEVLGDSVEKRGEVIEDDMSFVRDQILTATESEEGAPPPDGTGDNIKTSLMWLTAEDERVCSLCGPLNGIVVDAGAEFAPGVRLPVVDTHSRCRCKLVPIPKV